MKRLVLIAAAAFSMAAPLAIVAPQTSAAAAPNIVQVAASNPQFSTLVSLVEKAGLVGALSGPNKLTVLAPTNAAFAKVPRATLAELASNKALLTKVLEYHVVAGEHRAAQVVKLHSIKTLEGASLTVKVHGGEVFVNQAQVVKTNVEASNGVIHVINSVLLPPGV